MTKEIEGQPTNLVLFSKLGDSNFIDFKSILGNESTAKQLSDFGDRVQLKVAQSEDIPPFVIVGQSQAVNVSQFYSLFSSGKVSPNNIPELAKKLQATPGGEIYTAEVLVKVARIGYELEQYLNGKSQPFKINILPVFYSDINSCQTRVKLHNGRLGDQPSYITSGINKTNLMSSPDDLFYLELPDYDKLQSGDFTLQSLMPKGDVAKPYPHPIYYTPYILAAQGSPLKTQAVLNQLAEVITLTEEQKRTIPKIPDEHLFGSDDNNLLDIQDNEREFYEALKELIIFDIKQTFGITNEEEIAEKYKKATGSRRLLEYLQMLVVSAIELNWGHTGKYPIEIKDDDDDEEDLLDSVNDTDTDEGLKDSRSFLDLGQKIVVDGFNIVQEFITRAAVTHGAGFDAYIEAIIKLYRWGDRKPKVLKLTDQDFLVLNTLEYRTSLGIVNYNNPTLVDGYEMVLKSFIIFDERLADRKYKEMAGIQESVLVMPVGVLVHKMFGEEYQTRFISLPEVLSVYKKDPTRKYIKGLVYNNGTLSLENPEDIHSPVGLRQVVDTVLASKDKRYVFETPEEYRNLCLEYEVKDISELGVLFEMSVSDSTMSQWYPSLAFSSKEELAQKLRENPLPIPLYLKVNIASVILPYYFAVSAELSSKVNPSLEEVTKAYTEVAQRMGYTSSLQFLKKTEPQKEEELVNKTEEPVKEQQVQQPAPAVMQQSSAFESLGSVLITPVQPGEVVNAIKVEGKTVGGFVQRVNANGKKHYVVVAPSSVPENSPVAQGSFDTILMLVFHSLYLIAQDKTKSLTVSFNSAADIKELRDWFGERQ